MRTCEYVTKTYLFYAKLILIDTNNGNVITIDDNHRVLHGFHGMKIIDQETNKKYYGEEAYAEFKRTVAAEGMQAFLDQGYVIPFKR